MGLFQEVEGEVAVIVERGVYRQVPLYTRDGYLYGKLGAGFVRLYADGSTTKTACRLDTMTWDGTQLCRDKLGRLCTADVGDAKPLAEDSRDRLLLGVSA